ncbi:hypothetical protein BCR33DRAFT_713630 [Rhizoclosmatium globosum]|uniref:Uncharacterized protein n=1 Tax=Rhizoclosmatium globosum TaxID=329046 RepID=A0A1Y2CSU9_9FUNG|nr:hypothetical protein BCR33DRAFT_713630 [Rhizoclosmatium globosum]|eukprot:ORY50053.1 hypothetical protein BCR33DRAFT_713630 [Rhizoclosmatium globosum]
MKLTIISAILLSTVSFVAAQGVQGLGINGGYGGEVAQIGIQRAAQAARAGVYHGGIQGGPNGGPDRRR